jgi:hypothetical protein
MSLVNLSVVPGVSTNVVGDKAYVYTHGTTTQVNCYSDAAGNNLLPQPILAVAGKLFAFTAFNQTVDIVWGEAPNNLDVTIPAAPVPSVTTVTAEQVRAIAAEAAAEAAAIAVSEAFSTAFLSSANEWTLQQLFDEGVVLAKAALATTATTGFTYIPTCAGPPTGTPVAETGTVPLVLDTTDDKLYAYIGGAWKSTTLA